LGSLGNGNFASGRLRLGNLSPLVCGLPGSIGTNRVRMAVGEPDSDRSQSKMFSVRCHLSFPRRNSQEQRRAMRLLDGWVSSAYPNIRDPGQKKSRL
jgi:hypothetical protein